jgi:hypothetical protein
VIEKVNAKTPLNGLRFIIDHAETITDQLARIKKLGGGVAVQDRMHFQGESYWKRYGAQTRQMPPIRKMLEEGEQVGVEAMSLWVVGRPCGRAFVHRAGVALLQQRFDRGGGRRRRSARSGRRRHARPGSARRSSSGPP